MRDAKVPHHGVPLGPVGVGRTAVEEPIGAPSLAESLQEVKDALVLQAAMLPASKSRCQMNVGNTVASHGVTGKDEVGSPQVEEFGRMEHAQETATKEGQFQAKAKAVMDCTMGSDMTGRHSPGSTACHL